jgi:hypothetical protein
LDDDDEGVMMVGDDDDMMLMWDGTVVLGRDVVTTQVPHRVIMRVVHGHLQGPRFHLPAYTRKVDIFKADMDAEDDGFLSPPLATALQSRRSFSADQPAESFVPMETSKRVLYIL